MELYQSDIYKWNRINLLLASYTPLIPHGDTFFFFSIVSATLFFIDR